MTLSEVLGVLCRPAIRKACYKKDHEVCFLDQRRQRGRGKFDHIRKLEGRIDYLEGVIYHLFQLTEQLLETVEKLKDDEPPRISTHTELIAFMTVMDCC